MRAMITFMPSVAIYLVAVLATTKVSGSSSSVVSSSSSVMAFTSPNVYRKRCRTISTTTATFTQPQGFLSSSLKTSKRKSVTWVLKEKSNDDNNDTKEEEPEPEEEVPTLFGLEPKSEPPPTLFGLEPKSYSSGGGELYDDNGLGGGLLFTGPLILIASIYSMIYIFFGDYDDVSSIQPPDYIPPPPGL